MEFILKEVPNARDLGGISAYDEKKIKTGRIIRSSNLALLSAEGCRYLKNYGLKKIVDFRTMAEITASPDVKIDDAEYIMIPILKELTIGITRKDDLRKRSGEEIILDLVTSMGPGAREWMANLYTPLISDEYSLSQYRKFLDVLKDNKEGAVLYHCTVGKDRVGVGTVLFLLLMGASREDILTDYMKTNDSVRALTDGAAKLGRERAVDEGIIENIPYINGVHDSYIGKVFDYIGTEYASTEEFFRKRLGIDESYINEMRENYLER